MAAPKDTGDARLALDPDVDFAGYDPYIVALTGGGPVDVAPEIRITSEHSAEPQSARNESTEGRSTERRKVALMAWLRDHSA